MSARRILPFACAATLLFGACAAEGPNEHVATVPPAALEHGVAQSQAPEPQLPQNRAPEQPYDPVLTAVVNALVAHDYAGALALTETARFSSPWLDYDRGEALAGLGRTDEAIETFKSAQQAFREGQNFAGEAAAMWGRAHALGEAGRCPEARQAYEEYATSVRTTHPAGAEMATAYAKACRPVVSLH